MVVLRPTDAFRDEAIYAGDHPMNPNREIERPRGLQAWLLIYTFSGRGFFAGGNDRFDVSPGEIGLIDPNAPHRYGNAAAKQWKVIWTVFADQARLKPLLDWPSPFPGYRRLSLTDFPKRHRVEEKLREMQQLVTTATHRRIELGLNALEAALLWIDEVNPISRASRWDPRVRQIVDFIYKNLGQPLSADTLCAVGKISTAQLTRLFHRDLRTTPSRFIESERLNRARQLLDFTSMSIQSIAWEVGFEDPFYFATRFRKAFGKPPRAFRKR